VNSKNRLTTILALSMAIWVFATVVSQAANTPAASDSKDNAVQQLLQTEAQPDTATVNRRDALNPVSRPEAAPDVTWWQAGYVQSGKHWVPYEESIAQDENAIRWRDYLAHRESMLSRPHGRLQLANWCRKNGFADQERVHLLQAMSERDSTLNFDSAYQRLGCQKINGAWVSPVERQEAEEAAEEVVRSHRRWDAKLEKIRQLFDAGQRQRELAEKQMLEITDVSAVPAIVDSFTFTSQPLAELGIRTIGQIREYQASRALAGQAVFSPWRPIRMTAIELLKDRKLDEYVPDLMLLIMKPVKAKLQLTGQTWDDAPFLDASMNWDYVWVDESATTVRVAVRRLFPVTVPAVPPIARNPGNRIAYLNQAVDDLINQTDRLDYSASKINDFRSDMNDRVTGILAKVTNQPPSSDPVIWWQWWATYNNLNPAANKSVIVVDERKNQPNVPSVASNQPPPHNCLIAGTPVWTETGFIPIEQIKPGDRVLSKDIQSGELKYKPVLQTTVREPTAVQKFRTGDETIVASPGHHFWVSGDGWTKVRDFTTNQPLHTVTGMQRIESTETDGGQEKVYNLIVADFHTYFVGKTMLLSHDVLPPKLTNVKVPGLQAE
jgi:hypothetical protein